MNRATFAGVAFILFVVLSGLLGAVVELLAGTGLRVSEMLRLSIGDIEIGERFGKVTVRKGKHSGFREVPLTKDLRYTFNTYLEDIHGKVTVMS